MINPRQCRAARALLGITQQQLAEAAGIGKRTVIEFEQGTRDPMMSTVERLRYALESQGIDFLGGDGRGSGVRFRDPETEDAAESPRILTRRQMLGSVGLLIGSSVALSSALTDSIKRARADLVQPSTMQKSYTHIQLHNPGDVLKWGSTVQQRALEDWRMGSLDVAPEVQHRVTMTYLGPDGRQWIEWQGHEVAGRLFNEQPRVRIPMFGQTDSNFGSWAESRISACQLQQIPHYHRCHAVVVGSDGLRRVVSYTSLHLPRSDGRVMTISARYEPPGLLKEQPAMTSNQTNEDQGSRSA